jgi:hypothetical protein
MIIRDLSITRRTDQNVRNLFIWVETPSFFVEELANGSLLAAFSALNRRIANTFYLDHESG